MNLIICWGHTFEHFGVKKMFCFNVLKKLFIVFNNEELHWLIDKCVYKQTDKQTTKYYDFNLVILEFFLFFMWH